MVETAATVALVLALMTGWLGAAYALADGLEVLWCWLNS